MWTDTQLRPFLAITAHYISALDSKEQKIQLNSRLLAFHHLPGKHAGENMAKAVYEILKQAGILTKVGK